MMKVMLAVFLSLILVGCNDSSRNSHIASASVPHVHNAGASAVANDIGSRLAPANPKSKSYGPACVDLGWGASQSKVPCN